MKKLANISQFEHLMNVSTLRAPIGRKLVIPEELTNPKRKKKRPRPKD